MTEPNAHPGNPGAEPERLLAKVCALRTAFAALCDILIERGVLPPMALATLGERMMLAALPLQNQTDRVRQVFGARLLEELQTILEAIRDAPRQGAPEPEAPDHAQTGA